MIIIEKKEIGLEISGIVKHDIQEEECQEHMNAGIKETFSIVLKQAC